MTGKTFEEFHAGDRYSTGRRTITEHDILQFVTLVGLNEPLFLDMEYIRRRSVPYDLVLIARTAGVVFRRSGA